MTSSANENGSDGNGVSPKPRRSGLMTRYEDFTAAACASHIRRSQIPE
jgi:hypothetical protein